MDFKDHNYHTCDEWMKIIQECRASGLSDATWCREKQIPISSFYSAVKRCREKACSIPEAAFSAKSEAQEVVPITFGEPVTTYSVRSEQQDLSVNATIQIVVNDYKIQIANNCAKETIQNTLLALREIC